ncbi:uncharacterized protein LAESUDRAFT_761364 [Laetiporus sulphureus 93-53]|uniref:Uncharacterized protein n=1 Tax=Laetiporus sulphureus 93-53 TaxID=1314785 RepID=A0A165D6J4_9APHY|nr:uncharacterized protein LAESUDRAFT_761364 [Laetiporus sulphureus 93-53]KZT04246.1 hypothetical protein LAESUDRAFT_761364 [Laetiporus sulphureus 93-53]
MSAVPSTWHNTVASQQVILNAASNPWVNVTQEMYRESLDAASSEPRQAQSSEEPSSDDELEVHEIILSSQGEIVSEPTEDVQAHSHTYYDYFHQESMQGILSVSAVEALESHVERNGPSSAHESELPRVGSQYGLFSVQDSIAIDNDPRFVSLEAQHPEGGTITQQVFQLDPPGLNSSGPSVDESDLTRLLQAMSLAVANGIKEGVQRALDAVVEQKSHCRSSGSADARRNVTGGSAEMEFDEDEYFGDVEHRERPAARTKCRRGPRSNNAFNARFRQYLRIKGILPADGRLPASAMPSVVEAFIDGIGDGPDITLPLMDWSSELSSLWNKELILLLSREFLQRIKSGSEFPLLFDPETMTETTLLRSCTAKLRRMQAQVRHAGSRDWEERKANDAAALRRNTRRQGIFVRRAQIVNANKGSSPALWNAVENILEKLEVAGMSSDHTDEEASKRHKVVRRAQLPWRHDDVDALLSAVDGYQTASGALGLKGN